MEPGKPDFNYLPFKVHNNVVYLAGQLAKENGLVKSAQILEEGSKFPKVDSCLIDVVKKTRFSHLKQNHKIVSKIIRYFSP